jgi:aminoglycoside phosphotransferase (APT) family kinase protein
VDLASLEPLEGGWSGETFLGVVGDDRVVVRICARDPGRAEVDAALLRLVHGLLPVPEVLEARPPGQPGSLQPALLVTSWVPGERGDLLLPRLDDAGLARLGTSVGALVATLGGMPVPRAGALVVRDRDLRVEPWDGVPDDLPSYVELHLDGLRHWTRDEHAGLLEVADAAQELLDTVARRCLVHSDVNPKNLLVDPDSLAVTALLDWEYAHAGHPFTDLGNVLRSERQPGYVDAVLAAYEARLGVRPDRELALARAADLWALVDLATRRGANPVAARAHDLLLAIARTRDPAAPAPG